MENRDQPMYTVVVPVCNEEATLPKLTDRLVSTLAKLVSYEIIFVNDGSIDQSEALIEQFCSENSSIKLVSFSRNFGHQAAVTAGLNYSTGAAVAVMDGDLQDPPEALIDFFSKWEEGYQVVYGIRRKRKENIAKRAAYFLFYRILQKHSDINIPLDSGDFSVMDRVIVDKLNSMPEHNRFVRGIRAWLGYRQIGLEYDRQERFAGKAQYTLSKLFNLAYDGVISFSRRPLVLATRLGLATTSVAFIYALVTLYQKIFEGIELQGWTSLIVVVLFFGGMQLLMLGLLGEYIGRIFDETRGRPNYIVARTTNIGNNSD